MLNSKRKDPLKAKFVYKAAVIYFDNGFYFFGGKTRTEQIYHERRIIRLDSELYTWSLAGKMKRGRLGHNVIRFKNDFYVIGGTGRGVDLKNGYLRTNKCTHKAGMIK